MRGLYFAFAVIGIYLCLFSTAIVDSDFLIAALIFAVGALICRITIPVLYREEDF